MTSVAATGISVLQKSLFKTSMVVHAFNPTALGGRYRMISGSRAVITVKTKSTKRKKSQKEERKPFLHLVNREGLMVAGHNNLTS